MSFQTVWVFTAIIMVCVITDMVEAQYRFPIYYRIARRFDAENQGVQEIDDKRQLPSLETCPDDNCRQIPRTQDKYPSENKQQEVLKDLSREISRNEDGTSYKRVNDGILYQNIRRRSPKPTSWRIEGNEDKENWSEKQAIIQQFLLKSWTDWNKKSKHGKDDFNQ